MGRPPTGHDPMISVRLPPELIERIDEHAKRSGESRSEAMRALLEVGLIYKAAMAGGPKPKRTATDMRRQRRPPKRGTMPDDET